MRRAARNPVEMRLQFFFQLLSELGDDLLQANATCFERPLLQVLLAFGMLVKGLRQPHVHYRVFQHLLRLEALSTGFTVVLNLRIEAFRASTSRKKAST